MRRAALCRPACASPRRLGVLHLLGHDSTPHIHHGDTDGTESGLLKEQRVFLRCPLYLCGEFALADVKKARAKRAYKPFLAELALEVGSDVMFAAKHPCF